MNRCQIVQGIWWALQNLMNQVFCVAYEQNVIVYNFLLNFVMSFASAADHQASSAIVSKQTFYVKNSYTITFCSYATQYTWFIKFWSDNHVPWTIWHLFLGYRGISIIRGKIVAIANPGTQVLALKNLTHSNLKNPGFKPGLGTWIRSLIIQICE